MRHFSITFIYRDNHYQAFVQKISSTPVEFTVYDIYPSIAHLPDRLVFLSSADSDQLVYKSFDSRQSTVIKIIAEAIFITCNLRKIPIHA
jgi:hypothetical protein